MPATDNRQTSNLPAKTPRDPRRVYIEHTKGVWLRTNLDTKEAELWFDGQLQTSWSIPDDGDRNLINVHIACAMMAECVGIGKRLRSKEFKDLINA